MDNNKEDIFYNLISKAKETKLTERERNSLFLSVDAFVARNPIKKQAVEAPMRSPAKAMPIKSPFFKQDWFFAFSERSHNFYIATALVVLAIFGTGTSFAAENSLPGDILYPVKVNVLEEVKSVFLPTSLKPQYEIERAQTRVDEVTKLAEQNKLSDDIKASVAAKLDSHISTVKQDISNLQQKGDIKQVLAISNSLETALDQSQDQIDTLADNKVPTQQVDFVKNILTDSKESTVKVREGIENQIYTLQTNDENTLEIAKAKHDVTQKELSDIEARLASQASTVPDATVAAAPTNPVATVTPSTAKIAPAALKAASKTQVTVANPEEVAPTIDDLVAQVKNLLKQGQDKMDSKQYNEAFALFREANYLTQIIDFRLGEGGDIGQQLDTVLQDINSNETDIAGDPSALIQTNATGTTATNTPVTDNPQALLTQ